MPPRQLIEKRRIHALLGGNGEQTIRTYIGAICRECTVPLVRKPVFDQRPDRRKTIAPGDLLAFRKASARVRDRYFGNPQSALENLSRNFWLEVKTVAFNPDSLDRLAPEELVASLHVSDRSTVKKVGDPGQE